MVNIPKPALITLGVSVTASVAISVLIWRRHDHVILKVGTTLVAFFPIVGPLFALWIISFPDRMHPSLQAKYPKRVNFYSVPDSLLIKNEQPWHSVKIPQKRRRSVRRRSGGST
jgi:hypothetical protein